MVHSEPVDYAARGVAAWSRIDWSQTIGADPALPLTHYPQLESGNFTREQRLGLARLAACFSCELFIHFEGYVIDYLSRYPDRVPTLSATTLARFVEEERVHADAFRRLLGKLRPDLYSAGTPLFLSRRPVEDQVLGRLGPTSFFLLAMLFEEITLFVPEAMRASSEQCSALVREVMSLHARDEQAHVGIDTRLLEGACRNQKRWRTALQVWLTLPVLWFVDRQVARGWKLVVQRAHEELGLSSRQRGYLLQRQPTQSDRWGSESFIAKLGELGLPGSGALRRVLAAQLG